MQMRWIWRRKKELNRTPKTLAIACKLVFVVIKIGKVKQNSLSAQYCSVGTALVSYVGLLQLTRCQDGEPN